jgi:hypothetical protein
MSFLVLYAIAWVTGIIAAFVTKTVGDLHAASRTFLLWQLVIATGLGGFLAWPEASGGRPARRSRPNSPTRAWRWACSA